MKSQLMDMLAKVELYKVVGVAFKATKDGGEPIIHVDHGRLYAATSNADAEQQARKFWTEDMAFDSFSGAHARVIRNVGEYRIVLVKDEENVEEAN